MTQTSTIYTLMQDMADALRTPGMLMLGGGSPALIDEATDIFQKALVQVAQDKDRFTHAVCRYSDSAGDVAFRDNLADYLNQKQGWKIDRDNVLITGGSQSAFKLLFEHFTQGARKILFPILPDYIGYGILRPEDMLGIPGEVKLIGEKTFRYQLSGKVKEQLAQAGALCVSRPCNPSGGMIEDNELTALLHMAAEKNLKVIIDGAYGQPIPDIVYSPRTLPWADNAIYCLSLSKLGLPGVRTGMVIAQKELIQKLAELNAKQALAPGGVGPAMANQLIYNGDIDTLTHEIIRPWYSRRKDQVIALLEQYFKDLPVRYHMVDGGFFNWLYCEGLPIDGHSLYEECKKNKVVVVPGYTFAPGLQQDWPHLQQCFRISTGQPLEKIEEGLKKIVKVLQKYY